MNLELVEYTDKNIDVVYKWKIADKRREYYTCRPVKNILNIEEYKNSITHWINIPGNIYLLLKDINFNKLIGEVKGFDLNPRNRSMEFGFYLPEQNRNSGYGTIMVRMFIDYIFEINNGFINKIYATTANNNEASKKVLLKNGFKVDGRNREHYWIGNDRYDQLVYSLLKSEWKDQARKLIPAST